jgi:phosphatidylserine/phosphatidylglycerophosphate/cardiolipin synthase-like enzyme
MIGVGRLAVGQSNGWNRDPSDTALIAMMDSAQSSIHIAQQDIGSVGVGILPGVMPDAVMDAWLRAAFRGVDVNVVVSNLDSFCGQGTGPADSYSNGFKLDDLWEGLVRRAGATYGGFGYKKSDLCKHVHFSNLRSSSAPTWPDGKPLANHAKVFIVDEQAYYVGSQNLYDADLAEYGVIVDDRTATEQFVSDYYAKLASYSSVTTYRDPSCR